jgi:DNA-binding LacI/PurR family transcriptional regulator
MPVSRYPTTREIATACGCSQSTVSNALRNDPRISEDTRARIQKIASEMGWKTNPLAAAFMAHLRSTKPPRYHATLAFAVSHPQSARVEDLPAHQRDNFKGAKDRAEQLGYVLEPIWVGEPGINADNLARMLQSRGIPGLIIPSMVSPTTLFSSFEWDRFPRWPWGRDSRTPRCTGWRSTTTGEFPWRCTGCLKWAIAASA